jgi:hypothetical protein
MLHHQVPLLLVIESELRLESISGHSKACLPHGVSDATRKSRRLMLLSRARNEVDAGALAYALSLGTVTKK